MTVQALTATPTSTSTNTVTLNTGTGNDKVTLSGTIGGVSNSTTTSSTLKINLGDGDDNLVVAGAIATDTYATKAHAIDFGTGTDTLTFGTTSMDISGATLTGLEKIITSGTGILSVRASSVLGTSATTGTELSIFSSGAGTVNLTAAPGSTGEVINGTLAFLTNTATVATVLNETGNSGADTITGSIGTDVITGNAGNDYLYGDNSGTKAVEAFKVSTNVDAQTMTAVLLGETITATSGATAALSAAALNTAIQASTNYGKFYTSAVSTDTVSITYLVEGAQSDTVKIASTGVINSGSTATATAATNTVTGTTGTGGVDTIIGGVGADIIAGGAGADKIAFATGSGTDLVLYGTADQFVFNETDFALPNVTGAGTFPAATGNVAAGNYAEWANNATPAGVTATDVLLVESTTATYYADSTAAILAYNVGTTTNDISTTATLVVYATAANTYKIGYDSNGTTAGGETILATVVGIPSASLLSSFASTDFLFSA